MNQKELQNLYQSMKKSVMEDVQNGLSVELAEDTENALFIWDNTEFDREYRILSPDTISLPWLKQNTIITSSIKKLPVKIDFDKLLEWMYENIDKSMYLTLEKIIFINDVEADWNELAADSTLHDIMECQSLPEDTIGILWFCDSIIVINVGAIVKETENMIISGDLFHWEEKDCINYGILTTLAHEIRHLAQANPYLPEEILQQEGDDEDDAECYAVKLVARTAIMVLKSA